MKVIPVIYHSKKYPTNIYSNIDEIAGNFDKEKIDLTDRDYSLHTEYSHMKRKLDNKLINKYVELKSSHKDFIPQLWKSKKWASEFANFIIDLVDNKKNPKIIEIHPPFDDYCKSFEEFFEIYKVFENIILDKFPDVEIFIENRCGTFYTGGKFLLSKANSILTFLSELKKRNLKLKLVLDYPQVFSAELIKMDNIKLDKIISFNNDISKYIGYIGGFHIWGKRKKSTDSRWTPHTGNLNTFFSFNSELKNIFLNSICKTFNDDKERYFVPEVNSGEEDLQSIVYDLINVGIEFPLVKNNDHSEYKTIISIDWINHIPYFRMYDSKCGIKLIKIIGLKNIQVNNKKRCIGIRNLHSNERNICKYHNIVKQNETQCSYCKSIDSFKYCVMCRGNNCRTQSKDSLNYCNQEHFVYLAYFQGGVIKVGTAHNTKKEIRLEEQGALYAFIIAKAPNGQVARMIESEIVKLGIKESVSISYKLKNIIISESKEEIINKINMQYNFIKQKLSQESYKYLLDKPKYFNQYDVMKKISDKIEKKLTIQTSLFNNDYIIEQIKEIEPFIKDKEIISVIGNIGIVEDNGTYKCINLKKILSWEIESIY